MENPGFVNPSNLALPDLGTANRKTKVKYIKDIEDIITLPAIAGDTENSQVLEKNLRPTVKKDLVSKRCYRLGIGLTVINFFILLAFFSATITAVYYIKFESEEFQATLLKKMPQLFQKVEPMSEQMKEQIIKSLKEELNSMKEEMKSMKDKICNETNE